MIAVLGLHGEWEGDGSIGKEDEFRNSDMNELDATVQHDSSLAKKCLSLSMGI